MGMGVHSLLAELDVLRAVQLGQADSPVVVWVESEKGQLSKGNGRFVPFVTINTAQCSRVTY